MDSVGQRLDLTQVGTRYDHYMELKEVFMLGVEVINGMQPQYVSAADRMTKVKLENAVELIDRRLKYLSDFDDKVIAVSREVRAAGIHRTPLLGDENGKEQPKNSNSQTDIST